MEPVASPPQPPASPREPHTPTPSAHITAQHEESCVICLGPITERAVTVPCNHLAFDFICLASWLQERSNCPLCKTEVTRVEYDWRSPTDYKTYNVPSTAGQKVASSSSTPSNQTSDSSTRTYASHRPRLPPRRRPQPNARPYTSPPSPDLALLRRRHVYRRNLFSCHVGSNRINHYTDLTPTRFAASPHLQRRARAFIRRELRVFRFLYPSTDDDEALHQNHPDADAPTTSPHAEWLTSYILSILASIELKSATGAAEALLRDFLGRDHAALFLHELAGFLRSPYERVEEWDRWVQYPEGLPDVFDRRGLPVVEQGERGEGGKRGGGVGGGREGRGVERSGRWRSAPYEVPRPRLRGRDGRGGYAPD